MHKRERCISPRLPTLPSLIELFSLAHSNMSSINSLEGCRCNQSFISSRSVSPGPNDSLDTDDDRDPYRVLVPNEEVNTEGDNNIGGSEDTDNDADTDDDEDTTDRMDSHNSKDTGDDKDDINISDTAPWRSAQTLREANGSKTFSVAGDCLILLLPFLFAGSVQQLAQSFLAGI